MSDKAWKAWERTVAKIFGGVRRGPDTRGEQGGKTDVIHPHFGIEVKLLSTVTYSAILAGCRQAEANAEPLQEPVCVIRRKSKGIEDALVCYRLPVFKAWRIDDE